MRFESPLKGTKDTVHLRTTQRLHIFTIYLDRAASHPGSTQTVTSYCVDSRTKAEQISTICSRLVPRPQSQLQCWEELRHLQLKPEGVAVPRAASSLSVPPSSSQLEF